MPARIRWTRLSKSQEIESRGLMVIWIVVIFAAVAAALFMVSKRKKATKQKASASSKRPAIAPTPFAIVDYSRGNVEGAQEADTLHAVRTYQDYLATYQALHAGQKDQRMSRFVAELDKPTGTETDLERFVRHAFHPDVMRGYLALEFEENLKAAIKNGIVAHWEAGQLGEAALIAFTRTADQRFLQLYTRYFDRLLTLRDNQLGYHDDYHNKQMNAWGAYNLGRNAGRPGLWVAHVTQFSAIVLPATGFAREISSNPALAGYKSWASSVVAYFEQAYAEYDSDYRDVPDVGEKWYWRPLLEKYEATNHMHLQGQALLNIYAVTKNPAYAERIRSFLRIFRHGVVIHDDGLASWNYSPYFQVANEKNGHISRQYSEYSWKGEITVPFLYEAKKDGFDIGADVLDAVTSSIRDHILKDAEYKLHVHPHKSRPLSPRDRKKTEAIEAGVGGYHAAVSEDPKIEQQVVDIVATAPEHFPKSWFTHSRLAQSYARLLPRAGQVD